jgi:hypothetical protein
VERFQNDKLILYLRKQANKKMVVASNQVYEEKNNDKSTNNNIENKNYAEHQKNQLLCKSTNLIHF